MGTRSATGFRIDGVDRLAYNQYDGYPGGVGLNILQELNAFLRITADSMETLSDRISLLKKLARDCRIVFEEDRATMDDVRKFSSSLDVSVSSQSVSDWYCLLRGHQGSIIERLKSGILLDSSNFILDSLFCEYAYVLNLDDETLEVYVGFQEQPPRGRYAEYPPNSNGYYPCSLLTSFDLRELPTNDVFIKTIETLEGETT